MALRSASKGTSAPINGFSHGAVLGSDSGYTFNDDGLYATEVNRTSNNFYAKDGYASGFTHSLIVGRNPTVNRNNTTGNCSVYFNDQSAWKNTQVGRANSDSVGAVQYPWLPCASFVPSQWPDYQPCTISGDPDDYEIDNIIGKTKVAEYMKYLSNVRSLPVGVSGNNGSYGSGSYVQNTTALSPASTATSNAPACRFVEYRVSMPFISGIYGILADKMFPDLLIGANNIRIEFKLAQNNKALWLTMDPCRRVPGTVRDFTPFTGEVTGAVRGGVMANQKCFPTSGTGLTSLDANKNATALGCFNSRVVFYDSSTDATYGGMPRYSTPTTNGTQQIAVAATSYAIIRDSNMYNTTSALGEDLCSPQLASSTDGDTSYFTSSSGANQGSAGGGQGGHYPVFSNLPKPQYIPSNTPWSTKSYFVAGVQSIASHCNENAACFGTYLPASAPQTRRCQPSSRLAIVDNFNAAGTTVFAIRDLQVRAAPLRPAYFAAQ